MHNTCLKKTDAGIIRSKKVIDVIFFQSHKMADISNKFSSTYDVVEQQLKSSTIGMLDTKHLQWTKYFVMETSLKANLDGKILLHATFVAHAARVM